MRDRITLTEQLSPYALWHIDNAGGSFAGRRTSGNTSPIYYIVVNHRVYGVLFTVYCGGHYDIRGSERAVKVVLGSPLISIHQCWCLGI